MCRIEWHFWNQIRIIYGFWLKKRIKIAKPEYGLNKNEKRKISITLSLKTYNKRYETLPETLKSLVLQTVKPDRIIVWLDDECNDNAITKEMSEYKKYGVVFRYTTLDIKSHGKYYYAMQEYPEDIIITVDDDLIYPRNMIEKLVEKHYQYPEAICSWRVHTMKLKDGKIAPYNEWIYEERRIVQPSFRLMATGGAGTLYPPQLLPEETFNEGNITKYCLHADDIWLKIMEMKNMIPVVWVKNCIVMPPIVNGSQEEALSIDNVIHGRNDMCLEKLRGVYPSVFSNIERKIEEEKVKGNEG